MLGFRDLSLFRRDRRAGANREKVNDFYAGKKGEGQFMHV